MVVFFVSLLMTISMHFPGGLRLWTWSQASIMHVRSRFFILRFYSRFFEVVGLLKSLNVQIMTKASKLTHVFSIP